MELLEILHTALLYSGGWIAWALAGFRGSFRDQLYKRRTLHLVIGVLVYLALPLVLLVYGMLRWAGVN